MSDLCEKHEYMDCFGNIYSVNPEPEDQESGGQGTFMRTATSNLALKVMHDNGMQTKSANEKSAEKYTNLRLLPIPSDLHITLPLAPLKDVDGYVMQLLDDMIDFHTAFKIEGKEIQEAEEKMEQLGETELFRQARHSKHGRLLCSYMETGGVRRRLLAYMKAATILARLHTHGLVYCDFSDRNAFISSDFDFRQVWMIDADNLEFSEKLKGGYFTPGVAAPELIRKESKCTFYSDCFAYAVSFFQQLFHRHPLEGQAYEYLLDHCDFADDADQVRDEGRLAWILDSEDDSNNGRKYLLLPDDFLLTDGLRSLFQQTFDVICDEAGKVFPQTRPSMMQWAYEVGWAYDNTVYSEQFGLDYVDTAEDFGSCPYDDKRVHTVRLRSYLLDENTQKTALIWQFTHEIIAEDINVPLRIIEGFVCRHEDDIAFSLEQVGNSLIIHSHLLNSVVAYSEDTDLESAQFSLAGSFKTKKSHFLIRCQQNNEDIVLIEGEIHGC